MIEHKFQKKDVKNGSMTNLFSKMKKFLAELLYLIKTVAHWPKLRRKSVRRWNDWVEDGLGHVHQVPLVRLDVLVMLKTSRVDFELDRSIQKQKLYYLHFKNQFEVSDQIPSNHKSNGTFYFSKIRKKKKKKKKKSFYEPLITVVHEVLNKRF